MEGCILQYKYFKDTKSHFKNNFKKSRSSFPLAENYVNSLLNIIIIFNKMQK